jgi:hypothetical protein
MSRCERLHRDVDALLLLGCMVVAIVWAGLEKRLARGN